jgi:hypothetical protein
MASSYSTDLKLELMVTGENAGTWGQKTNNNLELIQQAIAGYEAVALSDGGTVALAMSDAAESNARNMVLKFTGTLTTASTVTIPDGIEKFYIIDLSAVVGVTNLTIKTVSGTGFTAGEAAIVAAYSDGTNLNEIALNTLGGTIATAQIDDAAISTAKLSNNAVTTAKISNLNVTEAKLAASAVTADKIAQSTITQAKLATNSVGPDQLISTGVTAAEYTTATITVDADGRITAASSGAGGSKAFTPNFYNTGPASGTFTANPASNHIIVYATGGGGGYGGTAPEGRGGGAGGDGGYAVYSIPVSAPYSAPYATGAVGNPGNPGNPGPSGNVGGATNLGSPALFTVNGGSGGTGSNQGGFGGINPAPAGNVSNSPAPAVLFVDSNTPSYNGPGGGNFNDRPVLGFFAGSGDSRNKTTNDDVRRAPRPGALLIFENDT